MVQNVLETIKTNPLEIAAIRGSNSFIPIERGEYLKVQRHYADNENFVNVVHPNILTDDELMRNHEIINKKRKSLGFKLFIAYKNEICCL